MRSIGPVPLVGLPLQNHLHAPLPGVAPRENQEHDYPRAIER
jgi:hypothetical protein